jgi:uncharacterized membrane protein
VIRVEHSVVINRPLHEVFAFIANVENNPRWQQGVLEARITSGVPASVGSTGIEVRQLMGRRVELNFEVTEYEENAKFSFKITSGPMPIAGTETFESVEGGTRVNLAFQGETGGMFSLAEPIMAGMVRNLVEADWRNLKALLEAGG